MKNLLCILCACIIFSEAFTERINGPANIRTSPKGDARFSLHDNVFVDTTPMENDWYHLMVSIQLSKEQYETEPLILTKGMKLFDTHGKEIGVVLQDIEPSNKMTAGGAPGIPQWYAAELFGYTYKSNIRPESIIEPVISELITTNRSALVFSNFQNHLRQFNYTDGLDIADMPHLTTYMVYESTLDDPSPLDRVRLIFYNEDLIAVVHSRDLNLPGYETIPIARERKLTILTTFEDDEKIRFVENNNKSYAGVD